MERLEDDPELGYVGEPQQAAVATPAPTPLIRLWPDPDHGPLRLCLWFGTVEGRPAVVGVEVWGIPPVETPWIALDELTQTMGVNLPDSAIKAQDVRLPLGAFLDARVDQRAAYARAARTLGAPPEAVEKYEQRMGTQRKGRPALSDEMLERVVEVYNAAVTAGHRDPAVRVFEELGEAFGASVPDTARGWVRKARNRWPNRVAAAPTARKGQR